MHKERWFIALLVIALTLIIVVAFFRYPRGENDMERELQRLEFELNMIEDQLKRDLDALEEELELIKEEF